MSDLPGRAERHDPDKPRHWLIERRVRVYPRLVLGMVLLTIPLYAASFHGGLDSRGRPPGTDFLAFWSAARVTAQQLGIDPWNVQQLGAFQSAMLTGLSGTTAWVSPPMALALVWPLGFLGFGTALIVWTTAGLLAFIVALRPVVTGHPYAWVIVAAFPGLWIGIAQGQTQFITAALIGGALLSLRSHPHLAGVLIGLMAVKPHLAILFPLVLIAGAHWRAFITAALSVAAFTYASLVAFGVHTFRSWIDGMGLIASAVDAQALPVYKFVTPYTSLRLLGVPEGVALVVHVLVAVAASWVVWTLWRRTDDPGIRGSALVIGTFLATPYAADYDLAVLAFPIAWMATLGLRQGWRRGDRNLLVATWVLPAVTAPIAALTHVTIVPLVMLLLLRQLWVRTTAGANVGTTQGLGKT